MQILRSTPATLELQVYQAGDLTNLDANPTLVITDANGAVVASGAVTKPGATTGIYRSILPGQAAVAELTAVWSGALATQAVQFTQHHQIVGSLLFTESQARAHQTTGNQAPLTDPPYTDAMIARKRELITDQFEQKTGRSWISRYCRMELHGNGERELSLSYGHPRDVNGNESGGPGRLRDIQSLISVSIGGVAATLSEFDLHGRKILRSTVWPRATYDSFFNVVVEYEYGLDPVDLEASENGLRETVNNLVKGDISQYAQSFSAEDGTILYPPGGFVWAPATFEWFERNPPRRVPVVA